MAAKTPNIEKLLTDLEKANTAQEVAKKALDDAVSDVEVGTVFQVGNVPHEVTSLKGKKSVRCMFSQRQLAVMRGETPPPIKRRKKRTGGDDEKKEAAE